MGTRSRKPNNKTQNNFTDGHQDENGIIEDPSRRQKKVLNHNFKLEYIKPLTSNQEKVFHSYGEGQHILLYGCAGTGKTFLGLYFALSDLLVGKARQVIIVRSAVSARDQGFLPGTLDEKMAVYEAPYKDIVAELSNGRRDVYDLLKKKGNLDFMSTSFLRGLTFDDSVVVLDEVQNMTDSEINTVLTRIGKNCRVIICGDFRQDDLKLIGKRNQESGIQNMIKVARAMPSFDLIEFGIGDIVRSGFVKEYIITRINLKLD